MDLKTFPQSFFKFLFDSNFDLSSSIPDPIKTTFLLESNAIFADWAYFECYIYHSFAVHYRICSNQPIFQIKNNFDSWWCTGVWTGTKLCWGQKGGPWTHKFENLLGMLGTFWTSDLLECANVSFIATDAINDLWYRVTRTCCSCHLKMVIYYELVQFAEI